MNFSMFIFLGLLNNFTFLSCLTLWQFVRSSLDDRLANKTQFGILLIAQKPKNISNNFESCFAIEKEVVVDESKTIIASVRDLKIDNRKNFWIADSKDKNVKIVSSDGTHIRTIGKGGSGPGEYGAPFCLAFNNSHQLLVGDPYNARVSILNQNGDFLRLFSTPDVREIIPLNDTQTLIVAPEFSAGKGKCLHLYTDKGTKIKSFFDIPQNAFKFNMILDNVSACVDAESDIYAVFNTEHKIYKYSNNGDLLLSFNTEPDRYVQAPDKFDVPSYSRDKMLEWINSWTQVLKLACAGKYIVACLSVHKEHEYELDIFSLDGKLLVGNIETDFRLLSSDRNGKLYFLSEEESGDNLLRRIVVASIRERR